MPTGSLYCHPSHCKSSNSSQHQVRSQDPHLTHHLVLVPPLTINLKEHPQLFPAQIIHVMCQNCSLTLSPFLPHHSPPISPELYNYPRSETVTLAADVPLVRAEDVRPTADVLHAEGLPRQPHQPGQDEEFHHQPGQEEEPQPGQEELHQCQWPFNYYIRRSILLHVFNYGNIEFL